MSLAAALFTQNSGWSMEAAFSSAQPTWTGGAPTLPARREHFQPKPPYHRLQVAGPSQRARRAPLLLPLCCPRPLRHIRIVRVRAFPQRKTVTLLPDTGSLLPPSSCLRRGRPTLAPTSTNAAPQPTCSTGSPHRFVTVPACQSPAHAHRPRFCCQWFLTASPDRLCPNGRRCMPPPFSFLQFTVVLCLLLV